MIAMSDAVIILVSAAALSTGIYRWQNTLDHMHVAQTPQVIANNAPVGNTNVQVNTPASAPVVSTGNIIGSVTSPQENVVVVQNQSTVTPITVSTPVTDSDFSSEPSDPLYGVYVVSSGDSLSIIAERYGSSVASLREINGIDGSLITIGQELLYPLPAN